MATTTSTSATTGSDWAALAAQGLGFLEALAAIVTPTPEQEAVADNFLALARSLGRPPRVLRVTIDVPKKTVTVIDPPDGAFTYRIGAFSPGGKGDQGPLKSAPIALSNVDPSKPFFIELYDDDDGVLFARAVIR